MNDNSFISVGQFVNELLKYRSLDQNTIECDMHEQTTSQSSIFDYMQYGYHAGWLEDMDITGRDTPLLRKNAARIIHEFMRLELREPDLDDVSCATKLRDLYDCRVCAKHVMQVYAKGIMEGYYASDTLYLFGMNEPICRKEIDEIISRIFVPENRAQESNHLQTSPCQAI